MNIQKACCYCFSSEHKIESCPAGQAFIDSYHQSLFLIVKLMQHKKIVCDTHTFSVWLQGALHKQCYGVLKQMYKRIKTALPDEMHIRRNPEETVRDPFIMVFRSSERYITALQYFWCQHLQRPLMESKMVVPTLTNIPHSFFEELDIPFVDKSIHYQSADSGNGILTYHPVGFLTRWFCGSSPPLRRLQRHIPHLLEPSAPPMNMVTFRYGDGNSFQLCRKDKQLCSICLNNTTYLSTQCGHEFCACLLELMMGYGNTECPLCRCPILEITILSREAYDCLRACNIKNIHLSFEN